MNEQNISNMNNILNNELGRSVNYFTNSHQNLSHLDLDKERRDQLRKMIKQNQQNHQMMMNFNSSIPFSQRRTNTNLFNQFIQNQNAQNSLNIQQNQGINSNQQSNQLSHIQNEQNEEENPQVPKQQKNINNKRK